MTSPISFHSFIPHSQLFIHSLTPFFYYNTHLKRKSRRRRQQRIPLFLFLSIWCERSNNFHYNIHLDMYLLAWLMLLVDTRIFLVSYFIFLSCWMERMMLSEYELFFHCCLEWFRKKDSSSLHTNGFLF